MRTKKFTATILSVGACGLLSTVLLLGSLAGAAAGTEPMPQTARQALLEMLFSKTPGTFEKHLPQLTRSALRKAHDGSGTSMLDRFSLMNSQMSTLGRNLQTFDAGSTLAMIEDPQAHTKFEVAVERDDLRGEEDEIELSFHGYKDGETQTAGTKVRFTLTMKQETGIWRLEEITVAVGVSLTDPEFLKAMSTSVRPTMSSVGNGQATAGGSAMVNAPSLGSATFSNESAMSASNEASAVSAVRILNTAQVAYAASFPQRGFTCALSNLGGMGGGGGPNERQAMLIDPRLAQGRKNGYVFKLSGCDGTPASKYTVTATPADSSSGTRAFCSDESAVVRVAEDGKAESCLASGKPVQ